MNVLLGIDGGGTRTRAALYADGRQLAYAEAASIKRLRVGDEAAERNLRALLTEVYLLAGVTSVQGASVGMASVSMPGVKEWVQSVFKDFAIERSEIVGDEIIALDAAFRGGPGILQIAGTGSNCVGRAQDGNYYRAGGWSSRLGDEGSGYWIGLNAVRQALKAYDRDEPSQILRWVGEIWSTPSLDALVNLGDSTPGPDFAALAPAISDLANAGDLVAQRVLKQAASDLSESVLLVRSKMQRNASLSVEEVPVAWTGSVLEKMPLVREGFFTSLKSAAPALQVSAVSAIPLEGAIWRAGKL